MILFNITYSLDPTIERDWLRWAKTEYLPMIEATTLTDNVRVLKLLTELDNGAATYSVQVYFTAMESFLAYHHTFADAHQRKADELFANKYATFRTLLEDV
ncbi:DUF4286 family protein [Rudanella lutea]|uniref:DUF4286 family protein n=1 Tax=Rudanella lutea TaxID=451374 RepID=UPI000365BC34|nr:DUF4286 family protein [Rudanella lutea]